MRVTILGSGTSTGVPVIGCHCPVCKSNEPKNNRSRASIMIEINSKRFIIDTGPEFRLQMLRENIEDLDAVIYTHLHADHCHGFDDLRAFYFRNQKPIPCYLAKDFHEEMKTRFHYAFSDTGYHGTKPQVDLVTIPDDGVFDICGVSIETFRVAHGPVYTSVFRIGKFAYATDFKVFEQKHVNQWRGKVDAMVASGIRFAEHSTHSSIPETLALFDQLGIRTGIITHLSHEVDHLRDSARLPGHVRFAFDGMKIDV